MHQNSSQSTGDGELFKLAIRFVAQSLNKQSVPLDDDMRRYVQTMEQAGHVLQTSVQLGRALGFNEKAQPYGEALENARNIVRHAQSVARELRTGWTFQGSMVGPYFINVTKTNPANRYRPTGLYMVIEIKKIK